MGVGKVHIFQHSDYDHPASILKWLVRNQLQAKVTRFYFGDQAPDLAEMEMLIVLGGPMNVDQDHDFPWLKLEKKLIEKAMKLGVPTLGICLGAQMLSRVMGHSVRKAGHWEVGWHPIEITRPTPLTPTWPEKAHFFHWHEDTFELPKGALHFAKSAGCENQGFLFNDHVVGLQFHPEVTPEWIEDALPDLDPSELGSEKHVQSSEEIRAGFKYINQAQGLFFSLLTELYTKKLNK